LYIRVLQSNVRSEATVKRNQLDASARRMYLLLPLFVALTQLQTSYVATLAAGIAAQAVLVLIPGQTPLQPCLGGGGGDSCISVALALSKSAPPPPRAMQLGKGA